MMKNRVKLLESTMSELYWQKEDEYLRKMKCALIRLCKGNSMAVETAVEILEEVENNTRKSCYSMEIDRDAISDEAREMTDWFRREGEKLDEPDRAAVLEIADFLEDFWLTE